MLASPLLITLAAFLVSTASASVTSIVTVTSISYLPLEECCGQETGFPFGSMAPKPTSQAPELSHAASPVTESLSSPSATLSTPSDQCTAGPSVFGADCSATGYCCPPASCDVTTLKCINPDGTLQGCLFLSQHLSLVLRSRAVSLFRLTITPHSF